MTASAGPRATTSARSPRSAPIRTSTRWWSIYIPPLVTEPDASPPRSRAGRRPRCRRTSRCCAVFMSSQGRAGGADAGPRGQLPSYSFPENAAMALAAADRYGRWRERPRGHARSTLRPIRDEHDPRGGRPRRSPTRDGPRGWRPRDSRPSCAPPVSSVRAAERARRRRRGQSPSGIGYPLVAKVIAPGVLHKSDVGGVIMGLDSPVAVAAAAVTLAERTRARPAPHSMASCCSAKSAGGIEALVGVTTDPTFGPLRRLRPGWRDGRAAPRRRLPAPVRSPISTRARCSASCGRPAARRLSRRPAGRSRGADRRRAAHLGADRGRSRVDASWISTRSRCCRRAKAR